PARAPPPPGAPPMSPSRPGRQRLLGLWYVRVGAAVSRDDFGRGNVREVAAMARATVGSERSVFARGGLRGGGFRLRLLWHRSPFKAGVLSAEGLRVALWRCGAASGATALGCIACTGRL